MEIGVTSQDYRKMNPIRKYLLRYQSHELIRMAEVMILTVLICLAIAWLFSEKANAESGYEKTALQLDKTSIELHKLSVQYTNCLNGGVIGRNTNGIALICGEVMEIKLLK